MSDSLRALWLRGIAFNPAAPADALIRLLDPAAGTAGRSMCEGRALPDAVLDAALRHPDRDVRGAPARNPHVDPARLAARVVRRLRRVRGTGSPPGRGEIAPPARRTRRQARAGRGGGGTRRPGLPPPPGPAGPPPRRLRHPPGPRPHLLTLSGFPRTGTARLIGHPDPQVRALAAADPALPDPPLDDPDPAVRRAAAANPALAPGTPETLLADPRTAEGAAANPSLPAPPRVHALLDHCLPATA
ncbi:hypothetical protein [Streptomyces omiyaensis]|uniref:hypothetical protein n=1 Tax=Streptomyces omiyaensis TaxID=68247 RepID=UPI0036F9E35D